VQYVWSPVYVDAMVLRDRDSDGDGTLDERLGVVQDANYNVTALFDNSGNVVERYLYDPFGQATVLDVEWNVSVWWQRLRLALSASGWTVRCHQRLVPLPFPRLFPHPRPLDQPRPPALRRRKYQEPLSRGLEYPHYPIGNVIPPGLNERTSVTNAGPSGRQILLDFRAAEFPLEEVNLSLIKKWHMPPPRVVWYSGA
jgi:hypothetical protein